MFMPDDGFICTPNGSAIHHPLLLVHMKALQCHLCCVSGIARSLLEGNRYDDPSRSAGSFRQVFQQRYGPNSLDFVETGWEEAAAQAHRQYKFLLVYLHAAEHQVRKRSDT